jgi:hypothetical protein
MESGDSGLESRDFRLWGLETLESGDFGVWSLEKSGLETGVSRVW